MKFDKFKNQRLAVIFVGTADELTEEWQGWQFTNGDMFLECYELWGNNQPIESAMFSDPIPGIRQHLIDKKSQWSGVLGNCLIDKNLRTAIQEQFLSFGYDVLTVFDGKSNLIRSTSDHKVRISFNQLN